MYAQGLSGLLAGLPDPDRDAPFYDGVRGRRLFGWCLDAAIILLAGVPLALVIALMTFGFGFVLFPMIVLGTGFLYRTATLASGSATWGMRFAGIEFRRGDGTRFDLMTAALHSTISVFAIVLPVLQLLSCGLILTTRYRQSLADLILGTTAINRPAA